MFGGEFASLRVRSCTLLETTVPRSDRCCCDNGSTEEGREEAIRYRRGRDLEYQSREKVSHIKQHDARVPMFRPNNKRPLGFPAAAAFPLARARRPSAGATFALLLPSWESWG